MQAVIPFPDISPELFSVAIGNFTFALRWYALAYIVGIIAGWRMAVMLGTDARLWPGDAPMTRPQVESLVTYIIIGIVAGGRLGYCLFYQPAYYLSHPLEILAVWQGGMSFHGGFLGVVLGGHPVRPAERRAAKQRRRRHGGRDDAGAVLRADWRISSTPSFGAAPATCPGR